MPDNLNENQRAQWMLASLVLILGFILGLVLLILISPRLTAFNAATRTVTPTSSLSPVLSPTPSATLSPTVTRTPRDTFTPTPVLSATPSLTPSETLTPPGPPTLTPARPLVQSAGYDLVKWTADEADRMARLMDDYPNTLSTEQRGENELTYYQSFQYAVVALQEAILRFPQAPQVDGWRWMLAYDLARLGDERAGDQYADLIAAALNRSDAGLSDLYLWFQAREPRLALYMVALDPPQGYLSSYLIEVRGSGSAFIWLVETPGAFQAFVLVSHFDFVNATDARWIRAELDRNPGDGDEVAIYFSTGKGQYQLNPPRVFNLARVPAFELPFLPGMDIFYVGMDYDNQWAVVQSAGSSNDLVFRSRVFPACPMTLELVYRWNGSYFDRLTDRYQLENQPIDLAYCGTLVDHAAEAWGPKAAISLMEALSPEWPPPQDLNGQPYRLDAFDGWRYRLAVYHALVGDVEAAKRYLNENIQSPSLPLSSWIEPSKAFLQGYKNGADLYRVCTTVSFCDPAIVLKSLVSQVPGGEDVMESLWGDGVQTHASGYFDFEGDDQPERWFTVRHRPLDPLQFWILGAFKGGVEALYAGIVEASPPGLYILDPAYVRQDALQWQPVFLLDGRLAFSMQRYPDTLKPYLISIPLRAEYPNRFLEGYLAAEKALFAGENPALVYQNLRSLADDPGLLCRTSFSCDPYDYLLGLAAELSGDLQGAIDAYHQVWLDYSRSPYTTMARLKLAGSPVLVSPSPTLSYTPTITQSATATPSPTQTLTPTVTPTPTITGTRPTNTPTIIGTLFTPTSTITPTPTSTPTLTPAPFTQPVATYPTP